MKIAKVTRVYKKGSKIEYSDYKSISLRSSLAEIIEKLMHQRVMVFLKDKNFVCKNKLGFKKMFMLDMQYWKYWDDNR